jgi:iron complex outermembrane receptor protein
MSALVPPPPAAPSPPLAGEAGQRQARSAAALLAAALLAAVPARGDEVRASDLADLSLEELANIEVTSVSRRPEPVSGAAASIFVITNGDLRRSGARTLPEALRLAPNLQVARVGAASYAISARGFNNAIGNKLLVLIDGRTVYTPLFSGVFWDMQDVMLEDVDRIEVISGPGATLWGANAVNGVINVITRTAEDTQGALLALGGGDEDTAGAARFGGALGGGGHYRLYGKGREVEDAVREDGASARDGRQQGQVGFRADWIRAGRQVTLQGDAYRGEGEDRPVAGPIEVAGVNLLARWSQPLASGSALRVKAYFDRAERRDRVGFQGDVDTFDVELQHAIHRGRHEILWGAGYRHAEDDVPESIPFPFVIAFDPPRRGLDWQHAFVQDGFRLGPALQLTGGLKLERNVYTGWEYLPSVRLAWKPEENALLWGAVSRAVRAPARLDRDFTLTLPPGLTVIGGGPDFVSEIANIAEVGYRAQPSSLLSYSITAFHHDYERLRSGQPPPAFIENRISGPVYGVEGWAVLEPVRRLRLAGGFTALRKKLRVEAGSPDPTGPSALGNDPERQWSLRSSLDLPGRHEVDGTVRHVGSLPEPAVPGYTVVDLRWGWRPVPRLEVSLAVRNLFAREHPEVGASPGRSEVGRDAFVGVVWRSP